MEAIIEVENLGLRYTLQHERFSTLKERLVHGFQRSRRREYLWAVQGLSFRLERGQSLGIIGRNGSGKSSLLKVLSGVLPPDQGRVRCRGRVSALLELGTGFHPELTGTENILLYGAMMGVPRAEMQRRVPRIAAFAEVENFIDIPVKNYSTGMYTRLAFSAAIDVEPDLLLVDEVLAVGDQSFQAKCYQRIEQLKREGVSIVLVAHDLGLVERFCEQALRLDGGRAKGYGASRDVIAEYLSEMSPEFVGMRQEGMTETVCAQGKELQKKADPRATGDVAVEKISVFYPREHQPGRFPAEKPFSIGFHYRAEKDVHRPSLRIRMKGRSSGQFFEFDTQSENYYIGNLARSGMMECFLPGGALPADHYRLSFMVESASELAPHCGLHDCLEIELTGEKGRKTAGAPAMFRISHDPFSMSRCCRFHYRDAGLEKDFATYDKGWHEAEFQGVGQRWTRQEAEWALHNPEGRGHLLITLHAAYKKPGDPATLGEIYQGSKSLGKFVIPDAEWKELNFMLDDRAEHYPKFRMVLSGTAYAGDFTGGADQRELGVAVIKIRLV